MKNYQTPMNNLPEIEWPEQEEETGPEEIAATDFNKVRNQFSPEDLLELTLVVQR